MSDDYKISGFWSETHPLSEKFDSLSEELVPDYGMCDTVEGEMLRAAIKIHYDLFNNGWGCNNCSGAVVYLKQYAPIFAPKLNMALLDAVHNYSHGERTPRDSEQRDTEYSTIVTSIVAAIVDSINTTRTPNTIDMWGLSEPDAHWEDEEEEFYEEDEDE